jgi:hypothetical protein
LAIIESSRAAQQPCVIVRRFMASGSSCDGHIET